MFLALQIGLPLLLEGEPGVGKTTAAKVLAAGARRPADPPAVLRGAAAGEALYDWNYQRQLLAIRLAEATHERLSEAELFTEEFLIERPILACVRHAARVRRCCSSTRSTGPTTSSRHCSWSSSARPR